jgi:glycerol-3-phosphate acyltransferase PlsY
MKILFFLFAYLFGAIPAGYILFRLTEKKDIRNYGSGNIGATNMLRLTGWKKAIPILIFDMIKGFLPIFLALKFFTDNWTPIVAGSLAILGHCFPVYIKFKGGKGVATTLGAYIALAVEPLLCIIVVFLIIVAITRYISLGSLTAVLSFPLFSLLFNENIETFFFGLFVFLIIAIKHKKNIQRLISGTENKIGEKRI